MAAETLSIQFSLPAGAIPRKSRAEASRRAKEAYVMNLLREGEVSQGRAAELLGISRWTLSDLMGRYGLSPFAEQTEEELRSEVADALRDFEGERG